MNFAAVVLCVAMLARALNAAPLNAMDVIVVEQADGSFTCSPFYVRTNNQDFMTGIARVVDIKVNGEPVDVHMEMGANGMAYFSHEFENETDENSIQSPENLISSPENSVLSPVQFEEMRVVVNQSVISINNTDNEPKSNGTVSRFSWFKWRRSASTQNSTEQMIDINLNPDDMTADYLKAINSNPTTTTTESAPIKKMHQSFQMSSEQIESLNLKSGINEMEFSFGSNTCKCNVFRWNHTDKVVISDIDGTITKSDVLGHVMPIFGKDWTQDGVAELFTKIEHNGYKFLYLSARAISHSSSTRDYLRKIQQGNETMPDGPILLNPTSTMKAFHREVIKRQSELFKIESLNAIKDLFPENPFYAGYGNRINDEWAYDAVGISKSRIFLINSKGELKNTLTESFQSTYQNMTHMVDHLYPPVNSDESFYDSLKWLA